MTDADAGSNSGAAADDDYYVIPHYDIAGGDYVVVLESDKYHYELRGLRRRQAEAVEKALQETRLDHQHVWLGTKSATDRWNEKRQVRALRDWLPFIVIGVIVLSWMSFCSWATHR